MPESRPPPAECANCGADIPRHARACPECGADERTGWRDSSIYDGLDLPEEAWRDEDPPPSARRRETLRLAGLPWYWWLVGVGVAVVLAAGALGLR